MPNSCVLYKYANAQQKKLKSTTVPNGEFNKVASIFTLKKGMTDVVGVIVGLEIWLHLKKKEKNEVWGGVHLSKKKTKLGFSGLRF